MTVKLAASILVLLAMFGTPALAQTPIVIKFSHVVAPDTPKGKGADRFKALAERYTNGRVKVEVYPDSTLYKDKDELEALQIGAVQMLAPSLAKFATVGVREFEVFDLPFVLHDRAALRRVTEGPLGRRLLRMLEPKSIVGLDYWDNGFKVISADRPLRDPADFRGLRMRIQSSKVSEAQFRRLGAVPEPMAFSDVYRALQAGAIDGTENTPSNILTQKHYEFQRYVTVSEHGYLSYAVIANKRFWDGLPADVRSQLEAALREATAYVNEIAGRENAEAITRLGQTGRTELIRLSPAEKIRWETALEPVYTDMSGRLGPDLIREFRQIAGATIN